MILKSIGFFILAGLCEISGGYMVWTAIKSNQPVWVGFLGCILLATYGVIATVQPESFGRTYAAYGGIFVVLSLLWGWKMDKVRPDLYDVIGAAAILVGTAIILYAPRKIA